MTVAEIEDTTNNAVDNGSTASSTAPYEESWEPSIAARIKGMVEEVDKENADGELPFPFVMVALVGIPGSGKTISSFILANILESHGIDTMVMPHDGYHYPLESLRTFPDAEDAIYRRGAPDTFDPLALSRDLRRIKGDDDSISLYSSHSGAGHGPDEESQLIMLPGFDHAFGDPEPDVHTFDRLKHKVVLCEGLYLFHDDDGWESIAPLFDLKVFMDSDIDNCMERLKIRNMCIPGYTQEEIAIRCEKVDRVNAMTVFKSKSRADVIVKSVAKPVQSNEIPDAPTDQELALNSIAQTDVEGAGHTSDWTMDISSMGRSDMRSRSNTILSESDDPPPPPAAKFVGTWEPEQGQIILDAVDKLQNDPNKLPYMCALIGTPGSGKSVSSFMLANILEQQGYPTMICPHDGYHYSLEYLKTFPNPEDMLYRRGAPDTFDPRALMRDLERIKNGDEDLIKLPAFDHARGDPEPDTHIFDRNHHKVVLCEGLYLLHDQDGWEEIASMFDYAIFLNADVDICIERVKIRNQCIPGYTPEEIEIRCEEVDRVNAMTVMRSKVRADVAVDSAAVKK